MTCIFCRIIAREDPGSFVHQDGTVSAFLDLFPVNPGHVLVVPNRHFPDLQTCPPHVAGRLFQVAQQLGPLIQEVSGAQGFNVWTANGKAAGQEILHLHLHVLPRFDRDAFGLRFPKDYPIEASRDSLDEMANRIRRRLER